MSIIAKPAYYKILENGIEIFLTVTPGSKQNKLIGICENQLKIKIKAPPQEGKANKELIKHLSSLLGVPKSTIALRKGETSKKKVLFIDCDPLKTLSVLNALLCKPH